MAVFMNYEGSYCGKYNNALHAAYHVAQYEVLDERATLNERVHISDEKKEEYHELIEELRERNKVAQASADTQETTAQDSERDRLLSLLFVLTASGLIALDDAVKAAAQLLDIALTPYKGIQSEQDDAETESIRGLLEDLKKEELQEAIELLKLTDILTQLEAANNAFAAAKTRRIRARHTRYLQLSTEEVRRETDNKLTELQDLIRASGIIASVTPDQQDTVTFVTQLMNDMNSVARNYKTAYNQSMAQKKAHEEGGDEPDPAPTTPPEGEGTETLPVE